MRANRAFRVRALVQSALFLVLLVALVALLASLAREHRREWDVTLSASNTLAPATINLLKLLDAPLDITAYATKEDAHGTDLHRLIRERLRPYQRVKHDIKLTIIDPREQPERAAAAGISSPDELVIKYRRRTEYMPLAHFNEQNFDNTLMRLLRGVTRQIFWLEGHGERRLDGIANRDLGEFGKQLEERGLKLSSLNLALAQGVPENAAMLIIACPQVDLQPAEVTKIEQYLARGGNLLWLIDPGPLHGLEPLGERLGLVLTPGTIVDPSLPPRSGPPVFAVASSYARQPITDGFHLNTLFPYAREIGTLETDNWRITPLVDVAPRGWVEMGKLGDHVTFDKNRDLPGPVPVAAAFERNRDGHQQRVVVIGSGSFLSNTFIGNGGNLELGIAVVNWLVGDDKLISIEPRPAVDAHVNIQAPMLYLVAFSFLAVLPLAFAIAGIVIWWRRRRAA